MKKHFLIGCAILMIARVAAAQETKPDTVVIELAKTSKVVFTMKDKSDLPLLKQYDFQALFDDIFNKIESRDSSIVTEQPTEEVASIPEENEEVDWGEEDENDEWNTTVRRSYRYRGSRHSFNFDLGTNNFLLTNDKLAKQFPDSDEPFSVRPWGSWYLAINSIQRSRISNKFFIEWGLGMSWYNFKFEDASVRLSKDDDGVIFTKDATPDISFKKSKLTVSYINASFVPMFDFGGYRRKARIWERGGSFRIGAGAYAGYRIGSHTKVLYKEDGDRDKDKDRDSFYLNNFRYGVRVQLGIRSTDLFFNYDLNDLFSSNKPNNPSLNAISFGVIF